MKHIPGRYTVVLSIRKHRAGALLFLALASAFVLYLAGQRTNPPGFFVDESSIALNALTIARDGRDEYGTPFPLFFRAFGEYKNPVYIYLLAGVFKVVTPSSLVARRLSAVLGYLAAVALGYLAWRLTRRTWIAAVVFIGALATPMLFEISRLAFEAALYPLIVALFLIAVRRASELDRWRWPEVLSILALLLLLTYTYTIGRLFAPLMLICLEVLHTTQRRKPLRLIAVLYVVLGLVPIAIFDRYHPRSMTERFGGVSYLSTHLLTPLDLVVEFEKHYTANLLPLSMALEGDPTVRHHVPGSGGSILLATLVLAFIGAAEVIRRRGREDRWWWFVLAGTLVSLVPASLTLPDGHSLRLSPYAVFLSVLTIPALEMLSRRRIGRAVLAGTLIVALAQAAFFFTRFSQSAAARAGEFDAGFPSLLDAALQQGRGRVYLDGSPVDAHARWYAALRNLDPATFAPLPRGEVQPGSVLLTGGSPPPGFECIARAWPYALCVRR
jgi:4-amino-4-deoxy-L-arabinose transferase-like glycosyltransferase